MSSARWDGDSNANRQSEEGIAFHRSFSSDLSGLRVLTSISSDSDDSSFRRCSRCPPLNADKQRSLLKYDYQSYVDCPSPHSAPSRWEEMIVSNESPTSRSPSSWKERFRKLIPSFSVGKISVLLLVVASISRIPLRSSRSYSSVSLGSAAISSVTDTLFPILPFAGGLDLRKEDYWSTSGPWWEKLKGVVIQVQDAFAENDDQGTPSPEVVAANMKLIQSKQARKKFTPTISAPTPFVSLDAIAQLTLGDLTQVFRFAIESSREGFSTSRFLHKSHGRVRHVVEALQNAVERSRGKTVQSSLTRDASKHGDIDALKFAAAMRVFAEWRLLRQVPDGYKGYAVGMNLGHKDVVQNCAKIENTVHEWIQYQFDLQSLEAQLEGYGADPSCSTDGRSNDIRSPTLFELLSYEIELDVHPTARLPRLKEKSAGMGLLWVRRQFEYQARVFENVLQVPSKFSSTRDAVMAAYKQVYDRYHGWAVQKIFNYSFQAAPEGEVVVRHMNPHRLKEVTELAHRAVGGSAKMSKEMKTTHQDTDDNPFLAVVQHFGREWDRFARFVTKPFSDSNDDELIESDDEEAHAAVDLIISQEMMKDASSDIAAYLDLVDPLLQDLAALFAELNMDDPTRV